MSRSAKVRRFFGEADFDFALRIGECEELQELFDCGLMPLRERVVDVGAREIAAVVRLALVGGGMDKEPAARLVERHVKPGYLAEAAIVAVAAINAAVAGAPDEPLGEAEGSETGDLSSPTASSATPTSTEPAESSASPRRQSRKAPSGA